MSQAGGESQRWTQNQDAPASANAPQQKPPAPAAERWEETLRFILQAHEVGERLFEGRLNTHEDWVLISLLLRQDTAKRGIVAQDVMENLPRSPGTVRAILKRFSDHGYIQIMRRVGRTELLGPTEKLKSFVMRWNASVMKEPPLLK